MRITWDMRAFCLYLALVLTFLSYRSTTALLALAGAAKNASEDGAPGPDSKIDARENKPRPAKKQRCETRRRVVERTQTVRLAPDSLKAAIALLKTGPTPGAAFSPTGAPSRVEVETSKPQYLRLFLPASPGSPHSPPA